MAWKHFKLEQFGRSSTAKARGIDNTPKAEYYNHVDELVTTILDPLYEAWGSGIIVTSGYRCAALNDAVGGSKTSAHSLAYAADLSPSNGKIEEFKAFVMKWLHDNNFKFDQYINEYKGNSSWVHIGLRNRQGQQRGQYMLFQNGKYTSINPLTFKGAATVSSVPTSSQPGYTSSNSNQSYAAQAASSSSSTWTSTTSNVGYGTLTGKNVYINDIDMTQIQNNDIYVKTSNGTPVIDPETGDYMVSDEYLIGLDENLIDEIESIDELEKYPDTGTDDFLSSITSEKAETVSGISQNADGSYVLEASMTLREFMRMFWEWQMLVQNLSRSIEIFNKNKVEKENGVDDNGDPTLVINADMYVKQAFDRLGHCMREGVECPVCGKKVKYLLPGGYCCAECMLTDLQNKVFAYLMSPNDRYKDLQAILNDLCALLNQITLIINALVCIPDIIRELAHIPEKYKKYVRVKICEGFCELIKLIKIAMIKKNKLLKKLMEKIHMGIIMKPFAYIYVAIQAIQDAMDQAQKYFDIAYTAAIKALEPLQAAGSAIEAESFAWLCSPRSFISPMPYTAPDMSKIFVNLPGGSGLPSLALVKPLMPSGLCTINYSAIESVIQSLFPPLTTLDYYLEPDLFQIRFLFSDQSDLVTQIRQQLTDFLSGGPDYIPTFENLLPVKKYTNITIGGEVISELWLPNIGYIWFLIGLLDAWAPHSEALVGSVINPAL